MGIIFENLYNLILRIAPLLLWLGRAAMPAVAVLILIRCSHSLFFEKQQREIWGFLTMSNGGRYNLIHWENVIGRAKYCDIRVNFPSVSRTHAAVCRNDSGTWTVYPIKKSAGVLLNGQRTFVPATLQPGDSIAVGGVELYFFPSDSDEEARQAQRRTNPGRKTSTAATLRLLTLLQILTLVQFLPTLIAQFSPVIPIAFAALCALMWGLYLLCRLLRRTAYELETLAFLLTTLNFAVTAAYAPASLWTQLAALVLGIVLFLVMSLVLRSLRLATAARWPAAALASGLFLYNIVFGQRLFGAKNWIAIGSFSLQPSEFVKIAFILAGAATLDRLFARRNLIFTALFSAFCVGSLALMSDFGTAVIFFAAFLCIAFLRTGDVPSLVMMSAAAGVGGWIVLHFKPYVADRFAAWLHAWEYTQTTGYQQSRTMSAIAAGGLFGAGPDSGWLKTLGAANTDLVFGVVSEEFGLLLALCAVAAVMIPAVFALTSASKARSAFYVIVSCSTAAMLLIQTSLNVLGAVDLLPLTGVTFPLLSVGGSSMAACWGLLAFLKSADTRQNASLILRLPRVVRRVVPDSLAEDTPSHANGFFADKPDIPIDEIFGAGGEDA